MFHPTQDVFKGQYCLQCTLSMEAHLAGGGSQDSWMAQSRERVSEWITPAAVAATAAAAEVPRVPQDPSQAKPEELDVLVGAEDSNRCAVHPQTTALAEGLCAQCLDDAREVLESNRAVDLRENEVLLVTDYARANITSRRGDGLDGDEFLMHGWLKAWGVVGERRDRYNATILMPHQTHLVLSKLQAAFGLHNPDVLEALTITDLIRMNLKCLELAGIPENTRRDVLEHALDQVPSLLACGIPY